MRHHDRFVRQLEDLAIACAEGLGEQLVGCLFGELLAHPCGFQEQSRTHVFQEDGRRFLDKLSAVVTADEERRDRRIQHAGIGQLKRRRF